MADAILNPTVGGNAAVRLYQPHLASGEVIVNLDLTVGTTASVSFATTANATAGQSLAGDMSAVYLKTNIAASYQLAGARFTRAGLDYVVKPDNSVQVNPAPTTGVGTVVGVMVPGTGEIAMSSWAAGGSPDVSNWRAVAGAPINGDTTPFSTYTIVFRVPTAPIRPSSLSILGTMQDGTTFNVSADADGVIDAPRIKGRVNYQTGVVTIVGVKPTGTASQTTTDLAFLGITGLTGAYLSLIRQETLRFNAVAYTYLPLDAELLGIDPVRLPSDGRVPIFRAGGVVVVGHTATTAPATASNGGTVNTGRTRLSRVRVLGANGNVINTGYTQDLEAGTVTFTDVAGYSQPVRVEHRIEDMAQVRDAQIDGRLTLLRPLTHAFPAGSFVSSAFAAGDLRARTSIVFDQATWDGVTYQDTVSGSVAPASYNDADYPITVTNSGAVTERWAIKFTSNLAFQIIGEHLGVIGTGNINSDAAPINAVTGEPYFHIDYLGWGSGWSVGNILRINTVGAMAPVWLARTIKQGAEGSGDYSFTLLVRGDVDAP